MVVLKVHLSVPGVHVKSHNSDPTARSVGPVQNLYQERTQIRNVSS